MQHDLAKGGDNRSHASTGIKRARKIAAATTPRREGCQGRILVVDDNHDAADTLGVLLEFMHYEVQIAYDGQQAVEMSQSFGPDLVILDINMPVMDGYSAARALRRAHDDPRVVLVALTARSTEEDQAAAKLAGFDIHVQKPADGAHLARLIAEALESRH